MNGVPPAWPPTVPEVRVRGTYREIGRAVGETARPLIEAALAYYREHFEAMAGIGFAAAEHRAQDYLVYARRHLPQYVEELEGMAEASGQPLSALLVPNCGEEFTCAASTRPAAPACTGVAVFAGGRRIVGHNMDWYAVDVDKNVLFDVTCPDGTRFLTIAGVPYLPILGLSSHGLAYVGNSVYGNDARLGVPNVFVRRWALEAPDLATLERRVTSPWRARGSNHTAADRAGRLVDIETSASAAERHIVTAADVEPGPAAVARDGGASWYAHTNHYTLTALQPYEGNWARESRDRLARACALLEEGVERGDDAFELVAGVLRDHAGGAEAICGHPADGPPRPDQSITVASMICDLDTMRLHACAGPPCQASYREYSFED